MEWALATETDSVHRTISTYWSYTLNSGCEYYNTNCKHHGGFKLFNILYYVDPYKNMNVWHFPIISCWRWRAFPWRFSSWSLPQYFCFTYISSMNIHSNNYYWKIYTLENNWVHLSNCICRNSINIKCLPVLYLSRFTHSSPSLSCSLSFSFKSRALFVCSRLYTFRLVTLFHSSTTPKRLQYAGEVWIVERNLYENKCKPPQHKLDEWKYKGRGRWWRWVWEKAYFQLNKYSKNDKNGAVENYES